MIEINFKILTQDTMTQDPGTQKEEKKKCRGGAYVPAL